MGSDFWMEARKPKNVAARTRLDTLNEAKEKFKAQIATMPVASPYGEGIVDGLQRAVDIIQELIDNSEQPVL